MNVQHEEESKRVFGVRRRSAEFTTYFFIHFSAPSIQINSIRNQTILALPAETTVLCGTWLDLEERLLTR